MSKALFWEAQHNSTKDTRLARTWGAFHYVLGVLGICLAALAGFGGLSKLLGYQQVALIAIGSGIATGLITFLRSDDKQRHHQDMVAAWDNMSADVVTLYQTQPGANDTKQDNAASKESDPDGWTEVINALEERAKSLRVGKPTSELFPAWPQAGRPAEPVAARPAEPVAARPAEPVAARPAEPVAARPAERPNPT
jgi:hypothetical protein